MAGSRLHIKKMPRLWEGKEVLVNAQFYRDISQILPLLTIFLHRNPFSRGKCPYVVPKLHTLLCDHLPESH
jgi:hypothetical protein